MHRTGVTDILPEDGPQGYLLLLETADDDSSDDLHGGELGTNIKIYYITKNKNSKKKRTRAECFEC